MNEKAWGVVIASAAKQSSRHEGLLRPASASPRSPRNDGGKVIPNGFTLLEILLVVAAIAILAGVVIVAVNPGKQLADARNAARHSDVNAVLNAVYQYAVDSNGTLPSGIASSTCATVAANEICRTGIATSTCVSSGFVPLAELTANERYLTSLPIDSRATSTIGTGYRVSKSGNGRVTVCAPLAEESATISVTR